MKIKIPFKMFGKEEGEIVIDFPASASYTRVMNRKEIETQAVKDAERVGRYLGAFRDRFQHIVLGYERCPGIENTFNTLKLCSSDKILRERLLELHREAREKVIQSYNKKTK